MDVQTVKVVRAISAKEAVQIFAPDFKGIVRVCPAGVFGKNTDVHFVGSGVVEKVKSVSALRLAVVVELENDSVDDFVREYSVTHPAYKPQRMTLKQSIKIKRLKGVVDNLHPIEIV